MNAVCTSSVTQKLGVDAPVGQCSACHACLHTMQVATCIACMSAQSMPGALPTKLTCTTSRHHRAFRHTCDVSCPLHPEGRSTPDRKKEPISCKLLSNHTHQFVTQPTATHPSKFILRREVPHHATKSVTHYQHVSGCLSMPCCPAVMQQSELYSSVFATLHSLCMQTVCKDAVQQCTAVYISVSQPRASNPVRIGLNWQPHPVPSRQDAPTLRSPPDNSNTSHQHMHTHDSTQLCIR